MIGQIHRLGVRCLLLLHRGAFGVPDVVDAQLGAKVAEDAVGDVVLAAGPPTDLGRPLVRPFGSLVTFGRLLADLLPVGFHVGPWTVLSLPSCRAASARANFRRCSKPFFCCESKVSRVARFFCLTACSSFGAWLHRGFCFFSSSASASSHRFARFSNPDIPPVIGPDILTTVPCNETAFVAARFSQHSCLHSLSVSQPTAVPTAYRTAFSYVGS